MYDKAFYDAIRDGCVLSARTLASIIFRAIGPSTVIDVGCGEGHWGSAFADLGCSVTGIDGDYVPSSARRIETFIPVDLAEADSLSDIGDFDLVVCLEVAEHLPSHRAESFVNELCKLSPVVAFSAAIPGQGGTGHVNEQWPAYWVELFESVGHSVSGSLRWDIWNDDRIENWYRQNLLIAASDPESFPAIFDTPLADPLPLVHPVLYSARRGS